MKIIQVVHSFYPRYEGIGNYCYQLSKYLVEKGHQVEVITSKLYEDSPVLEFRDGFTIHRCPYFGVIGTNRLAFILDRILQTKADVIHAHSYIFLTTNQVALAKKLKPRPFLLHLHGGLEVFSSKNFSTNLLFNIKNNIYDHTFGKWTLKSADAIASVSKCDIQTAVKKFGLDKKLLYWVPNAVNLNMFGMCTSKKASMNIVFIGKFVHSKGIDVLVDVIKRILKERNDVIFTLVGKGYLQNLIEDITRSYQGKINLTGEVPHSKIPSILSNATILFLPSYSEGLPTVCLEAFACGVPVVATNVGGVSELVIDGMTGFLFPPGDVERGTQNILKLLDNEFLREKMKQNCRYLVEKNYCWKVAVKKIEKIYNLMV